MKKLIIILTFFPLLTQGQTVIPNAILDTMIFEVKYARQCRITVDTLQDEIKKLEAELVANGTAINLSQKSNETLSSLLRNSRDSQEIQGLQFQKDLQSERRKTKRWRKIGIIEGVGLIGLLILML